MYVQIMTIIIFAFLQWQIILGLKKTYLANLKVTKDDVENLEGFEESIVRCPHCYGGESSSCRQCNKRGWIRIGELTEQKEAYQSGVESLRRQLKDQLREEMDLFVTITMVVAIFSIFLVVIEGSEATLWGAALKIMVLMIPVSGMIIRLNKERTSLFEYYFNNGTFRIKHFARLLLSLPSIFLATVVISLFKGIAKLGQFICNVWQVIRHGLRTIGEIKLIKYR